MFGVPDEEMGQRVHAVVQPAVPGKMLRRLLADRYRQEQTTPMISNGPG